MLNAVELCKKFDGEVIHCCFRNDPETLFHFQLNWKRFVGTPDTDEIPEAAELHLPQYWRTTYSCVNEELLPIVKGYDHVYIAGVFTDVSVAATAMNIFDLNIPVTVVSDCVATLHGEDVHEAALKSLELTMGSKYVVPAAAIT